MLPAPQSGEYGGSGFYFCLPAIEILRGQAEQHDHITEREKNMKNKQWWMGVLGGAAAIVLTTTQSHAAILTLTATGTYTGSALTVDGVILVTGATASQVYTLDTDTKLADAVETIVSGSHTYQFAATQVSSNIGATSFGPGGGVSPHTFGFDLFNPIGAPALQSDLSNLSVFLAAFNSNGSGSSSTALYITDNAPSFRLDAVMVPEPATGLLGIAGTSLVMFRRRRVMAV